ncbi:hypothetical protein BMAGN_0249 [Bifidobacterium magnum]|uniref:Membrane associated protein n=2 Tax=Bifidobacterium magnum TaxID=1692 RepID=A0A087BB97_9BIFI|nr:hypothetical protein BMAGN_0249 [Bifidobacterium magnum]
MGYESLSALVVVAILVILLAVWLPRRTVKGMKQVIKHREDRYSSSLHLVDEESGTNFSDEGTPKVKGAIMPSTQTRLEKNRAYIAQVRAQRRAAIRRRQVLCAVLFAIAVVVLVLAFVLHFSPLFALIPAALLAAALVMGVQANKQASAWESKMAQRMAKEEQRHKRRTEATKQRIKLAQQAAQAKEAAKRPQVHAAPSQEQATDVMEVREIRRAIRDTQREKMRVMQERSRLQQAMRQAQQQAQHPVVNEVVVENVHVAMQQQTNEQAQLVMHQDPKPEAGTLAPRSQTLTTGDSVADNIAQDLISFSLGEARPLPDNAAVDMESLEIKSMKQVSKAEPAAQQEETQARERELAEAAQRARQEAAAMRKRLAEEQERKAREARERKEAEERKQHEQLLVPEGASKGNAAAQTASEPASSQNASQVGVNDSAGFHEAESASAVDAPTQSSDSLGTSLDSILARRGN